MYPGAQGERRLHRGGGAPWLRHPRARAGDGHQARDLDEDRGLQPAPHDRHRRGGSEFSDDHSLKVITFAAVVEEVREEGVLQQGASGDGELAGDV